MSVHVLAFGVNHESAPVSVRERVSLSAELLKPALAGLRTAFGSSVKEAAILSTCNRTEVYCAAEPQVAGQLPDWWADFNQFESRLLAPHVYRHERDHAVRHAFRVASGLDSMVLGEPQILGQMKTAARGGFAGHFAAPTFSAHVFGRQGGPLANDDRRAFRITGRSGGAAGRTGVR